MLQASILYLTMLYCDTPMAKLAMATGHAMLINLHLNRLKTIHF
jgi:hypothetical protein